MVVDLLPRSGRQDHLSLKNGPSPALWKFVLKELPISLGKDGLIPLLASSF
jgi:hypothetical protein